MFLQTVEITPDSFVSEIVAADYRTADVFRQFDIGYCCGARWSLETVCLMKGIDIGVLLKTLRSTIRTITLSPRLPFDKWDVDFIIDYIINVHHHYIKETLPGLSGDLAHFAEEHTKKYPFYSAIYSDFEKLRSDMLPHIRHEEEVLFPYLRQVAHAYEKKDSFGGLLVRTLRKPIAKVMKDEHGMITETLTKFRQLTDNYIPPAKACTSHHVILSKLKELDNDLVQHAWLETEILFPRVINMEKELLADK